MEVSIDDAASAVLRQSVKTERDQPAFDRVTMDGIALAYEASQRRRAFTIASQQLAGDAPHKLPSADHCIEVMTGAQLPHGCDCVIPLEVYDKTGDGVTLHDDYVPSLGGNIHARGSDRKAGETLLSPGVTIGGPEMAIIASAGCGRITVAKPIRTAIVSTGNELVDVDQPIKDYQVRRSNDRGMAAILSRLGYGPVTRAHLKDDAGALEKDLGTLLESHDFLIVSGGVSKGVRDLVPGILHELGVQKRFHGVSQRPGKPLWFGNAPDGQIVFGLPGNPVSSLVCFIRYVLPAMHRALGLETRSQEHAFLADSVRFEPELTWFLPVTVREVEGKLTAVPQTTNTSGDFASLAGTHGFVELAKTETQFAAGHLAKLYRW